MAYRRFKAFECSGDTCGDGTTHCGGSDVIEMKEARLIRIEGVPSPCGLVAANDVDRSAVTHPDQEGNDRALGRIDVRVSAHQRHKHVVGDVRCRGWAHHSPNVMEHSLPVEQIPASDLVGPHAAHLREFCLNDAANGYWWLAVPSGALSSEGRAMSEIEVNSRFLTKVGVHVEDTGGSGRPVVLIHGWPLSGASWKSQLGALSAAGYRAIAYDRRGFGHSDKPGGGYDYDTLTDDLEGLLAELELRDVTLVGFSMGGGEVARYVTKCGQDRLRSVVFAAAVPPYMLQTADNPDGPLTHEQAATMTADLTADRNGFFDKFTTQFFSVNADLEVTEAQRQEAIELCRQSDQKAALACMASFGTEDFRADLPNVTVPTLIIHGDGDGVVPFSGSGARTHAAIPHSQLVVLHGAPHGCNVSHPDDFNRALIDFLNL